jgi:ribosomal protein S27E
MVPLAMIGHVVIEPRANPHRTLRLVTDFDLLLAHTIASVELNQRTVVFEAPASLVACERCQEAYAEARRIIIEAAGGIAKWMEAVTA